MTAVRLEPLAVVAALFSLAAAFLAALLAWHSMWVAAAVFVLIPVLAVVCEWWKAER